MHNCRLTRNGLIDLALDEMPPAEAKQRLAELDHCSACREEYASLRNTWRVSGQALQSLLPVEGFWPDYHARLRGQLSQRLHQENEKASSLSQPVPESLNSPLWLRIWIAVVTQTGRGPQPSSPAGVLVRLRSMGWKLATTSVRVPVPVALALMLLIGISLFTLRARGRVEAGESANPTPSKQSASVETKIVQVPVIQEKVVRRVVYVEKKGWRTRGGANEGSQLSSLSDSVAGARSDASVRAAMSLVGFKPTDQIKLTITKGSYRNEK